MTRRPFFRPDAAAGERDFRWRGGEVSRLEGLADAVFALALALLILSGSVPETWAELRELFYSLPGFAASFAILIWIWTCHYQFHRRYGLEDPLTIFIDAVILFGVLLYAYPLRFIFDTLWTQLRFGGRPFVLDTQGRPLDLAGNPVLDWRAADADTLKYAYSWASNGDAMLLYGGGFALVFLLFAAQTGNAWRRRRELELDARERCVTVGTIHAHLISAGVGLLSIAIVLTSPRLTPYAGMVYCLLGPLHWIHGSVRGKRVVALRPADDRGRPEEGAG